MEKITVCPGAVDPARRGSNYQLSNIAIMKINESFLVVIMALSAVSVGVALMIGAIRFCAVALLVTFVSGIIYSIIPEKYFK